MADDLNKDLSRSEKLLKDRLTAAGKVAKDITNKAFRELINSVNEYSRSLDSITSALEDQLDIYNELKVGAKVFGQTLKSTLPFIKDNKDLSQKLVGIYKDQNTLIDKLVRNQEDLVTGELSSKKVSDDLLKVKIQGQNILLRQNDISKEILQTQNDLVGTSGQEKEDLEFKIAALQEINQELNTEKENLAGISANLSDQAKSAQKIENRIGVGGKLLNAFKKIPVLGDLLDIEGAEKAMRATAAQGGGYFKTLGSGISALGPSLMEALGPLALIDLAVKAIKFFIDAMFAASIQIANFQRNLAVSKDTAVEIRDRFFEISDSAKALANTQTGNLILQKDLVEAQESFNNALGLAVDLSTKQNEEFAAQFTNVKKFYNLNEQEQKGLINLNVINGKTVNETKNSILGQTALYKINTKEAINVKKVLKDVLTTSNSIKLSIRGGGEALTQAVINTQRLGISLADVDKISDSLLNFEQSISSELEAELLTGRDLNLEKARAAALSNDQVTLTEEINRLVKEAGPDFEKNKIAMQASAAAIGIGVDQLADMYTQQKAVEKFKQNFNALDNQAIKNSKILTDKEKQRLLDGTASTAEYYKFAKEQGKDLNSILGDEMATRLEAQDAQQKFNDSLEKAKETFSRFVDGGYLDKFADFITRFVESVGIKGLGKTLAFGLASDLDIKTAKFEKNTKALESETDPEKKEQLQAELNNQKTELRHDSLVSSGLNTSQADELLSAPDWSDIFSSIKNAITLNKSDEMISLMKQQNQHLENIVNKEGTIVLNGTKMGTAMAVGSYKTQ
jgi:hypothetical protein